MLQAANGDWIHDPKVQDAVYSAFESAEGASEELVARLSGLADEKRHYEKPTNSAAEIELF